MSILNFVQQQYAVNPEATTDKYALGYFDLFYDRILSPRKNDTLNLLEIGSFHGDSAILWRDYFKNGKIYSVDINHCTRLSNEFNIFHIVNNAYTKDFVKSLPVQEFDVIIDDGPHTFESMVFFLQNYLPILKRDGVLVLEDIIDLNWTSMLVDIVDDTKYNIEVVHTAGHQRDPILRDRWQFGLDVILVTHKV